MRHPERRLSPVKVHLNTASVCAEASFGDGRHRCLDNGFLQSGHAEPRNVPR